MIFTRPITPSANPLIKPTPMLSGAELEAALAALPLLVLPSLPFDPPPLPVCKAPTATVAAPWPMMVVLNVSAWS